MRAEYQRTIENLNLEIEKELNRYLESEKISMADFMKVADKMDVKTFNKKAEEYVKNKDFSQRANAELKLYNLKSKATETLYSYEDNNAKIFDLLNCSCCRFSFSCFRAIYKWLDVRQ